VEEATAPQQVVIGAFQDSNIEVGSKSLTGYLQIARKDNVLFYSTAAQTNVSMRAPRLYSPNEINKAFTYYGRKLSFI
jgi:hypothetical protein